MRRPPSRIVTTTSLLFFLATGALSPAFADGEKPSAEAEAFFESRVRPVLADRCWSCHGDQKQSSELRLDSRARMMEGGLQGPAIEPGQPEKSLLIEAVNGTGLVKMPPKGTLEPQEVEALSTWVRSGAPWPEHLEVADSKAKATETHWSFQPMAAPEVPSVSDLSKVATPVDAFVLARLESAGLSPSAKADRRTLIRRASFDLIGLPPTPEEVDAFVNDESPDAFARLVDRLLDSPQYGERWGRHWLDVARYADTKGYVFQEERRYPFSYTYRDYVVSALNDDKPYDQFLKEQIAADLLDDKDPKALAALGFLTVGRRFLNNQQDMIDDRIDVVSRGLMGLTVACARCHDHKYDPIPTEDYYSLYGVFASCTEPEELPIIGESTGSDADAYQKERAKRTEEVAKYLEDRHRDFEKETREKAEAYLLAAFDLDFETGRRNAKLDEIVRERTLRPELLRRLMQTWKPAENDRKESFLDAWRAFAALPADGFAEKAREVSENLAPSADQGDSPEPTVAAVIAQPPPESMREVVARYGRLLASASNPRTPETPAIQAARSFLQKDHGPFVIASDEVERLQNRAERDKFRALERKVAELDVEHPGAPPRAMVLNDRPQPVEPRVFLRGNPGRPGDQIPRRFLKILSGEDRKPFEHGSGRLDLANAIASDENPLTARVLVNRVWRYHFGEGLVRTASDFGLRGENPTHPELLDWLATDFVNNGWSLKRLHRTIMLSNAYQQESLFRSECFEKDPQNALLWRQNRQRLDFEATRDSLLAVSGQLDRAMGGRSVSITDTPGSPRRTLYGFIDRQNLDGLFRTFDLPAPDATSPGRAVTTVPQQGLFFFNSPFVASQSRALAGRLDDLPSDRYDERANRLYRLLFARPALPAEVDLARQFVEAQQQVGSEGAPKDSLGPWASYAQALLMTNEFLFID